MLKGKSEPVAAWSLVDVTAREGQLARRLDAPMLGRDARAAPACARPSIGWARERAVHRVTVVGPAGIGKSRLARELGESVAAQARVLTRQLPALWRGRGLPAARRDRAPGGGGHRRAGMDRGAAGG